MTNQFDFHGYTVKAAISKLEQIVGKMRMEGKTGLIYLITGRLDIQKEFMRILSEDYDLEPIIPEYNPGIIEVEIS